MNDVTISVDFLDKHIFSANHAYAMVYICALRYKSQDETVPSAKDIAKKLGMKTSDVNDAVSYWQGEGFDIFTSTAPCVTVKSSGASVDKSNYSPCEITDFIENDDELRYLYTEAQNVLGKTLSTSDIQTLFWIYDYLGLSAPLIMMIINYAVNEKKSKMRYIEKLATDWAEKGITSLTIAEQHLTDMERYKTYEGKIKRILDIDRPLLTSEKTIFEQWKNTLKPTDAIILGAYEICIERKNKFSLKYINGILKNWVEKGYKTKEDILAEHKPAYKQTSISNFIPLNNIDYDKREHDALQKKIEDARKAKS